MKKFIILLLSGLAVSACAQFGFSYNDIVRWNLAQTTDTNVFVKVDGSNTSAFQPLEDQRLSTTNSPTFTAVIWSYTAADGTNYLKEVTVNTNGAFEATTVNE
jgi:hypothetical protein